MDKLLTGCQIALPEDLKRANRRKILNIFRRGETVTIADIHRETEISKPTITRAVQHYCDAGMVRSLGLGSTTSMGGKKPELFRFADERKILCMELWPRQSTLALCGLVGDVYAVRHFDYTMENDPDRAFQPMTEAALRYLREQHVSMDALYGVALSVPGTVDYGSKLLRYNAHAPGWGNDVDLERRLKDAFGADRVYYIENAGKAAGRAVLLDDAGNADQRLLTMFTTWGVSACLIERGRVINGRDALIGEIGHMIVSDTHSGRCACGKQGCLESLVNLEHVRAMLSELGVDELEGAPVTFQALFAASRAGHPAARQVVERLAHWFAVALHNLSLAYNQEAVIFQGDYAWADGAFDRALRAELRQFRYYPDGEPFDIRYDRRELSLLAARGSVEPMREAYFSSVD